MNIILPRRDLLLLIARCCPAGGAAAARPLKPLFTTAAAQLYAESVVDGLKALCALWLAEPDPADRQFCEQSGVRGAEQLAAFFDCPVISTMYHHNLGPDDDTLLLPGTQERPSKALGKVRGLLPASTLAATACPRLRHFTHMYTCKAGAEHCHHLRRRSPDRQ